jgi:transcriptional regulator of acetoin/glycerol metabolism
LLQVASHILDDIADRMSTEPMSVILCDDEGVVLDRRVGDSGLRSYLDRVWLAPGYSYAERAVGTNAIGTALESRGPAHVFGHEHYVDHLENLACASVPIRHPITGRMLGVLDLTGWVRDANALMMATATMIAHNIQDNLLDQAGRGEVALLHDYLTACHRNRGAILAVSEDIVMMNDHARALLDPGDQSPLIAAATEALLGRRRRQIVVDLPSGATARVHCRPSGGGEGTGGVLEVLLVTHEQPQTRGVSPRPAMPLPATVGSGPLWVKCGQAVDRHATAREWVVLSGEPGSGRRTLARATHQMRSPTAHLRLLAAQDHATWLPEIPDELDDESGTLILSDVDQLPPAALNALADALEPYRESTDALRPWVVATVGPGRPEADIARLIDCFPRTIEVPPLRHHIEDVPELVAHFIAKLTHGGDLTVSAEAMRVLRRNRWPGNVEQLQQVVRKIVAKRRSGVIEVTDLPAEIGASVRRVLSTIEAIECDAIVEALLETRGNKAEAAAVLGVSRATVYRKVREYGITMPRPADRQR